MLLATTSIAQTCKGHVFFIMNAKHVELVADFEYYANSSAVLLNKKGISTSFHKQKELNGKTCFADNFKPNTKKLNLNTGYIMVKPDGTQKIINGVYTDVDLLNIANQYFN
jgi:hypothetical protein